MCWGDVQLMRDADGTEYFIFLKDKLKPEIELIHVMSD